MKKRALYLLPVLVTLILALLPFGAVCNFADGESGVIRKTYSYFSLVPYGYANFAPFLTALATLALTVLLTAYLVNGKARVIKVAKPITMAAFMLSLCPLLLGISYFSVVGALISLFLLLQLGVLHWYKA